MSRIDELIAFQKKRIAFYDEEIARLEKQEPTGKWITETDQERWIADFEQERRAVRDTISYLEAFKKYGVKP